jgi:hypothetical protein
MEDLIAAILEAEMPEGGLSEDRLCSAPEHTFSEWLKAITE